MADPKAPARWRRDAALARGERKVLAAVRAALTALASYTRHTLAQSGMDPAVLDDRAPAWRDALSGQVTPAIYDVFTDAWALLDRGTGIDPTLHGTRYLEGVWNRLVGASDEVFDRVRGVIEAGRQQGLHPSIVARDVDGLLADTANWEGRARTIARTETLGANNAGARASAQATAEYLGYSTDQVMRVWLATTGDDRTRETHQDADGQTIYGLDTPYQVGDGDLAGPGDPSGPPEEVINCRCTEQFWYPGDPEYVLTAGGAMTAAATEPDEDPTGVIVCALPAETDPCRGIGEEDKHATILFYGDLADLPDGYLATLRSAVAGYAQTAAPMIETVTGVESLGGDGARVWMLDPEGGLTGVHDDLPDYDSEAAPPDGVDQFPMYTPHVTIGYPETDQADSSAAAEDVTVDAGPLDDVTEQAAANVKHITFDRLAVWAGPEQTEYQLTGPEDGTDTTTEETPVSSTASATRETRAQTLDRLVASGFFPTRAHASQAVTAAAGDPAPVPVDTSEGDMAIGDPAPAVDPMLIEDPYGPNPDRFHGIALVEDEETGDRRVFAPGAVYWDDAGLPMPFGWQVQDAPGHDNAIIAGRIDTFERVGNAITYTGTWDLDGAGWETRRLVQGQFLRGVSVDTDDFDVVIVNPDGTPVDPFDMMMGDEEPEPVMLVEKSRLRSMTACRVPAFAPSGTTGAYIANGLPEELAAAVDAGLTGEPAPADGAAVAAIVAAGASYATTQVRERTRPPGSWYAREVGTPGNVFPVTFGEQVGPFRRISGYLAAWGTCHIGIQGTCVTPPHSITDYAHFAHGVTDTDEGPVISGLLTMDTGHAAPDLRALPAAAHYDDTGTQFGTIAVWEDDLGIRIGGATLATATDEQVDRVNRAGALSGDWRRIRGNLELVAALAVNTPGFPIPRLSMAASAADGQLSLVAAGIVTREVEAGSLFAAGTIEPDEFRALVAAAVDVALTERDVAALRRRRIEQATRTLRTSRATAAAARIGG